MELTKLEKYESEYFFKFNVKEGSQGEKECHDRPTEVAKFKFNGQKEKWWSSQKGSQESKYACETVMHYGLTKDDQNISLLMSTLLFH